jgi:hypothetical protein
MMAHVLRSIGNAVGTPPFKNTNRTTAKYTRKADKKARRMGFVNAIHRATFTAMLAGRMAQRQEAQ